MRNEPELILPGFPQPDPRALHAAAREQANELAHRLSSAAHAGAQALLSLQFPEGYWSGKLTADTTLESDFILLELWLYPPQAGVWNPPSRARLDKAVRSILDRQQPDGGWVIYEGGPSELNATVRAYTAMKIAGVDPESPAMVRARNRALALGGLQRCNSYTKINFSLFGLFPKQYAPTIPPELMLVPGNLLYQMSSWTRTILVPLSIVQSLAGERTPPNGINVNELFVPGGKLSLPKRGALSRLFHQADRLIKVWHRRGAQDPGKALRRKALREAERWMLERLHHTEGLGAIYPAMMYSIMAMDALGYERDHPDLIEAMRHFYNLILETEDRLQFQPCVSPVWDTAIALFALGEFGVTNAPFATKAADWILAKEVRRKGDWSVKRPDLRPGGWAFEFANEFYPDIDDTAMVLLALQHAKASDPERQARVEARAIEWLLGMQSSDGGWAAFDVDNNWAMLNQVPFADHNAMLDPTCPDITGRVLEALCRRGYTIEHPAIARGVEYLLTVQGPDGSWYGRWGVNYIYGTFLALRGLRASGSQGVLPAFNRAVRWLRTIQNADGGWGESCASYNVDRYVGALSTPSQTAWALLGLAAAGDRESGAFAKGIRYLLETQKTDGTWDEKLCTGTGFPNVFYLTYHLYRQYFPVLALATAKP